MTLTKSTTITRNADATAIDLRPGDTVTVQGATGSGGAVTATSVSATAPGVTSGFARLRRLRRCRRWRRHQHGHHKYEHDHDTRPVRRQRLGT